MYVFVFVILVGYSIQRTDGKWYILNNGLWALLKLGLQSKQAIKVLHFKVLVMFPSNVMYIRFPSGYEDVDAIKSTPRLVSLGLFFPGASLTQRWVGSLIPASGMYLLDLGDCDLPRGLLQCLQPLMIGSGPEAPPAVQTHLSPPQHAALAGHLLSAMTNRSFSCGPNISKRNPSYSSSSSGETCNLVFDGNDEILSIG